SILGYAQTLLEDPPDTPEQRERFLTLIVRDAERMRRLVDDLLNLSRVESGQAPPRLEWANLHNLVGRVLTQLRDQAAQAQVELRSEEHTSELQSRENLVCRLLLEKKKKNTQTDTTKETRYQSL